MKKNLQKLASIVIPALLIWSSSTNAQTISAGVQHSLFSCADGSPMATGANVKGQLGNGTTASEYTPISISSLSGIIDVSAGYNHSLFVKNDGTVWSSGHNAYGELGDGTNTQRNTPVQASGLTGITAVAAGTNHSLFLKNDGTVWSCGSNSKGQLGHNPADQKIPSQITSLSGITAIAVGFEYSLFLKDDGTVWGCGYNIIGQLADGSTTNRSTPVQVLNLTNIIAIAGGGGITWGHSLFVKNDGTVWVSGYNSAGQFGNGTTGTAAVTTAIQSTSLSGIIAVSAGEQFSLFLKNDGTVWSSGDNGYGQLGDGTFVNKSTAAQIASLSGITAISSFSGHSLFLKNDNTVWSCGGWSGGQLGSGAVGNQSTPGQVVDLCVATAGIYENGDEITTSIFPNPSNGVFKIQTDEIEITAVEIYNLLGEKIYSSNENSAIDLTIDISNHSKGVYYVHVYSGKKSTVSKIIIQ